MKKLLTATMFMMMLFVLSSSTKQFTIYMIGDSTMADKDMKKAPEERGWGMVLQGFFTENVRIENHAKNGRSSKSFITEGRWQKVLDRMKPGDYLVIQFGHNDEKSKDSLRFTRPWNEFAENYRKFIRGAKEKGVTPIVMNCVARRNFFNAKTKAEIDDEALRSVNRDKFSVSDEKINSDTVVDTHGDYAKVPAVIAREMKVAYVDANKISTELENKLGAKGSRELHMIKYNGKDNTHFNEYGAHEIASRLVDAMAKEVPCLKKYVRHYDYIVSQKGRGNYMTLQDAVDAAPMGKKTKILVLDGTWAKPDVPNGKKIKLVTFSNVTIK
ncbi:MAG: pectin esterase [Prevotella sp.]|nr:pectin esterase [Prevotella sp.]